MGNCALPSFQRKTLLNCVHCSACNQVRA